MKAKVIKLNQVKEKDFGAIKVKEIFNTSKMKNMSAAIIKLKGENRKLKNLKCHHFYFILKGSGTFTINDKKHQVEKGDLVFIPKKAVYSDSGEMTMLSFAQPRFTPDQVKYLD